MVVFEHFFSRFWLKDNCYWLESFSDDFLWICYPGCVHGKRKNDSCSSSSTTGIKIKRFGLTYDKAMTISACLHGGGGPQVGEVTRLSGATRLSIQSLILI